MRFVVVAALVLFPVLAGCSAPAAPPADGPQSHAEALLDPTRYPTILVDVDYATDYAPSAFALAALEEELEAVTGKDVVIDEPERFETEKMEWETHEISRLHAERFDHHNPENQFVLDDAVVLHYLYVPGEHAGESNPLAFYSPRWAYIAVFADNMDDARPVTYPSPNRTPDVLEYTPRFERMVLVHEVGHALGLVSCGTPMLEERNVPSDPCHSTSADSVMYRGTGDFENDAKNIATAPMEPVWHFDADDRNDLRNHQRLLAAGNGGAP